MKTLESLIFGDKHANKLVRARTWLAYKTQIYVPKTCPESSIIKKQGRGGSHRVASVLAIVVSRWREVGGFGHWMGPREVVKPEHCSRPNPVRNLEFWIFGGKYPKKPVRFVYEYLSSCNPNSN